MNVTMTTLKRETVKTTNESKHKVKDEEILKIRRERFDVS